METVIPEPRLAVYTLEDSVQGGTVIVTTLPADKLMERIKKIREKAPYGWTEEELLEALVKSDAQRIRVMLNYSGEAVELHNGGREQDALLYVDGTISINGDVKVDRYEESMQRLVETDQIANSIAEQVKRHKEEKKMKPSFNATKVFTAEKVGEKSIEAKKVAPFEAVRVDKPQSVLTRSFSAIKILAKKKIF